MKNTVKNTQTAKTIQEQITTARQQEQEKILQMTPQERVQYLRAKARKVSTPKATAKPQPQQTETDSTAKQTETDSKTAFTDLMRLYEHLSTAKADGQPYNKKEFENVSYSLAKALTFSVLKKCIDVSQSPTLKAIRNSIIIDEKTVQDILYICNNNYEYTYNKNGDYVVKVIDSKAENDLHKLINSNFGDGLHIVNGAWIMLQDETNKAIERAKETNTAFTLETPYTQRVLKKKVYIQNANSVDGWTDETTTPIQQVFKAIRREIQQSQSVKVPQNGYSYIPSIITDTATDSTAQIYKRLPKYMNIGSSVENINGKETAYTVSDTDFVEYENIIATLNLTARQTRILLLRLSGYGNKAISTYFGISVSTVKEQVKAIRKKATDKGLLINLPQQTAKPQPQYKTYIQPIVYYGIIDNLCKEYYRQQDEKHKAKTNK
jgi:DNA-binding CsgD family transcriptional regulator